MAEDTLVEVWASRKLREVNSTIELVDKDGNIVRFNTERYLNVLFSKKMKPPLRQAKSLTKTQLKNKFATDQVFYEMYLNKYNTNMLSYKSI